MHSKRKMQFEMDNEELEYILDRSARKLRYKPKRTINYVNKLTEVLVKLNSIPSIILSDIPSHKFYTIIRDIIRDLLMDWYTSQKLIKEDMYLLRNCVLCFKRLVNIIDDVTKLTSWLIDPLFINSVAKCISDIDRLLCKNRDKRNFKQLIRLFDVFNIYYEKLPLKLKNQHGLDRLFEATMDCLASSIYDRVFRKLKPNCKSMKREQTFFLISCPSFISSYRGSQALKIIEQILGTMIPRYASLLEQHIKSINQWNSPIIHAVHHILLTVSFARGYYTPYANGQPLQWFIDNVIRIISEESFVKKVNEKGTNPETILIDSALKTLTAFVHEPDLLVYIKHLKITSIFRPLIVSPNESIVLHGYVMLSYTLEEDDIKASEKESGRLLSKIFDSLRQKIKSLSTSNKNEEITEQNISLLVEALQVLVQHDQIKSEIIKQNALSLFIDGYQNFNNRSKRLLLESLGSITFDEEAARVLRENTKFINSIKDMQTTKDDGINKAAEKILWNLINEPERQKKAEKKTTSESDDKKEDKPKKEEYQHDIMISYCHSDKELVYRIHKYLSDKGYKIWFDRDHIYGPAMQAMADAVENAEFVILCMSDSYKRSVYCQAEAEYAFHCKRNLLPLIVRQGYRPDGWLGLIISSRIYVDFGRVEFKNACELIVKEIALQREGKHSGTTSEKINEHAAENNHSHQISPNLRDPIIENIEKLPNNYLNRNTSKSTYKSSSINQWTRKDVLDFLYDTNLHYMMPVCELLTGPGLIKLFRICQTKPSRFYKQLNEEIISRFNGLHLPIGIFAQFLSEMDRLINSSSIEDIEKDALQSKSVSPSSPPSIGKSTSSPRTVVIPKRKHSLQVAPISSSQQISSPSFTRKQSLQVNPTSSSQQITKPSFTRIRTSRNVQITTAYRRESLTNQTNNIIVQPPQPSSALHSRLNSIDEQTRQFQQINTLPLRKTSYTYGAKSMQETIYSQSD